MNNVQSFLNAIKEVNKEMNKSSMAAAVFFGEVISISPIQIKVDQRFIIDDDFLILTSNVTLKTINIEHNHEYSDAVGNATLTKNTQNALTEEIVITPDLVVGDKVILLRMQGGQQFVVLDKVVNIT